MKNPIVGLVVVASHVESGGERGEWMIAEARRSLAGAGLEIVGPGEVVWDIPAAAQAARQVRNMHADLLLILHCSWVVDSLQLLLVRDAGIPVLLWAVPYPETYSLASVKHISSVLVRAGVFSRWGYGLPTEPQFATQTADLARTAKVVARFRSSRAALVTPRSTWRLAGPQDTTYDEWDLSTSLGVTTVHLEIDEFLSRVAAIGDSDARAVLAEKMASYGHVEVGDDRLLPSAKVYLAAKLLRDELDLAALAVACYPTHFGLCNLAASWLSDEGWHLDPEGDVGHAVIANALMALRPAPVALAEPVMLDRQDDLLYLRHEGSAPASLAVDLSQVYVVPCGDAPGTIVEFPLRPQHQTTGVTFAGQHGSYRLWTSRLVVEPLPLERWTKLGRGFLAALSAEGGGSRLLDAAFETGADHHILLQEGDTVGQVADLAGIWGIATIALN
jgi:L-fucose isomerase-like protein